MGDIKFTITPTDLLSMQGLKYRRAGDWYSVKICPNCDHKWVFGIRTDDYNYFCLRTKCGFQGNFWNLLKYFGLDPREYVENNGSNFSKQKSSTRAVYGREKNERGKTGKNTRRVYRKIH